MQKNVRKTREKQIESFLKSARGPIFVMELHQFLEEEMNIRIVQHRSIIIRKLIKLGMIERIGGENTRKLLKYNCKYRSMLGKKRSTSSEM